MARLARVPSAAALAAATKGSFGRLFSTVAGHPRIVDSTRSRRGHRRFHVTSRVRELLPVHG